MLDWLFRPSCPCDPAAKGWVEERLEWLAGEFDDSAFSGRRIVLPTPEFFPDPYDASKKAVRKLLDRVCEYMDVVPDLVALKFVADAGKIWLVNDAGHYLPGAAGTYEEGERKFIIRIDRSELADPMGLVGTIAHELAHVRLLGESRIMREVFDNEVLTDLTVVHFGLGIFLANTPRNWESQYSKWPDSDLLKPEYMTRRCSDGRWLTWPGSAERSGPSGRGISAVVRVPTSSKAFATCWQRPTRGTGRRVCGGPDGTSYCDGAEFL